MNSNYYSILGVNKNCSAEEIRLAYRRLAREHHPDKGGNKEQFQKIQEAYEVLGDPKRREEYDNPIESSMDPFSFGFGFGSLFQRKKPDQVHTCKINLETVYFGTTKTFRLKRDNICTKCCETCSTCRGRGNIGHQIQLGPFTQVMQQPCPDCKSKGKRRTGNKPCDHCNSIGAITEEKLVEIPVKKGCQSFSVKVDNWGEQPTKPNELPGNVIIKIEIDQDLNFERKDLDLIYKTELNFTESIIGKEITIPHFEKPIVIHTKGFGLINPGKYYTIFNRGLIDENGKVGNLHIHFTIKYPDKVFNDQELDQLSTVLKKLI